MMNDLYCLWLGLQDTLMVLAMWLGASVLMWVGDEIKMRRESSENV